MFTVFNIHHEELVSYLREISTVRSITHPQCSACNNSFVIHRDANLPSIWQFNYVPDNVRIKTMTQIINAIESGWIEYFIVTAPANPASNNIALVLACCDTDSESQFDDLKKWLGV